MMHLVRCVIFLVVAAMAISCSKRDMDSPAGRLVGHWEDDSGDNLYYGKTGADGLGNYSLVQSNGSTSHDHYKIISEIPSGERAMVQLLFSDGENRTDEHDISKDGSELVIVTAYVSAANPISTKHRYVDNKTEP